MTALLFDPFDEYLRYLNSIQFQALTSDEAYKAASKKLHKRLLGLLILEHQVAADLSTLTAGTLGRETEPFLSEFRSDLLSAMLIFQFGLYKAANMSARSAVENCFRVITGLQGLDFRTQNSVFDLIALAKQSPARGQFAEFDLQLGIMVGKYGDLCKYVHSAGEEFLSLERKLGEVPRWNKVAGDSFVESLVQLIQSSASLLIYLRPQALRALRHDQRDVVLDSLPMRAKGKLVSDLGLL
jgi:hypothetical protein